MPEQNITTKFKVDVSDLKKGITEANKQIKLANAQFKAASAGMDDWEKSTDGLRAKLAQLESVISAQTSKLKSYQSQLERVEAAEAENAKRAEQVRKLYQQAAEQYGKNSDEAKKLQKALSEIEKEQANNAKAADDLRIKILNQTAEVKKSEKQYSSYEKQLADIENISKDVADDSKELGDAVKDSSEAAKDAGDGFTVMKGALADLVSQGIQFAIDSFKDLVTNILDLSEATREYRSMQATLAGSAESFGYSVEYAKNQYKEFYSYLGDDQMATNAITNLLGMQVSTESVSAAANAAIAVWSAYGDSIPIEGLTESINETAQVREVTGSLADALNWAGISEDDFNAKLAETNSTQEAADLIAKTLNDTYGESKKTYDELNGSISEFNDAQLELRDTQAEIGAIVEPVNAKLAELKNQILEPLVPLIQQVSSEFLAWTETIDWNAVGAEIGNAVGVAKDAFQWVIDNKDTIVAGLQAILAGFIAFKSLTFIAGIVTTLQGLVTAITGAQTAAAAFSAAIAVLGGPVTVVIGVITALVAAFTYLWNTCEPFKEFWVNLWENVKSIASDAADALIEFFTVTIPDGLNALIDWFSKLPENVKKFFDEVISDAQEWAGNLVDKAVETGQNFVDGVIKFFEELPYNIGYFIGEVLGNIISWGADMVEKAKETGKNFLNGIIDFFKNLPGNIQNFITTTYKNVVSWGSNMATKAAETGKKFVDSVVNFIKNLPGNVLTWLTNTVNNVINWGSELWTAGTNAAGELFNAVVDGVSEIPAKMLEIGANIVDGVWNGITAKADRFKTNVKNFFGGIVDGVKDTLGIHSPSTVFAGVGSDMVAGLEQGWNENIKDAKKEIEKDTKTIADVVKETLDPALDALGSTSNIAALEFEAWENEFGATATEAEKLGKQLESLTKQQDIQRQTVDAVQWAYDKIVQQYGESSAQALQYKETLLQEQIAYQELQTKIDDVNQSLSGQKNGLDILKQSITNVKTEYQVWEQTVGQTATKSQQLNQELQSLTAQQTLQAQIVAAVKAEYEKICLQYGENSLQALQYKETLIEEIGTHQQLQIEIDKTSEALAKEQDEITQLQGVMKNAITETDNFGNALTQLGSATSDLGDLMGNDAVSDVGSFISKLGNGIGTVLNFASSILGIVSALQSLSTAFAGVSTIFGGAAAAGGVAAAAGGTGILGTIGAGLGAVLAPEIVIPLALAGGAVALVAGVSSAQKKKQQQAAAAAAAANAAVNNGASSAQISAIQSALSNLGYNVTALITIGDSINTLVYDIKSQISKFADSLNMSSQLQSISNGIREMNENLNNFRAAVSNSVSTISSGNNVSTNTQNTSATTGNGGTNITYNQTINSPKPLNRLEIYRQTKNQLTLVGG